MDVVSPGVRLTKELGLAGQETVGSAAAFTAGGIALLIEWLHNQNSKTDVKELMKTIRKTALPKYPSIKCRDIEYGCGYFNPAKVLEQLERAAAT